MSAKRGPSPRDEERQELILHTLKKQGSLGFSEIHKILKIEIGSKETLSKELSGLIHKHEIQKDESTGKYTLLGSSLFNAQFDLTSKINEQIRKNSDGERNPEQIIEELIKWSGVLSLFCALKEINTNRDWTKISANYMSKDNYLKAFLKKYVINNSIDPNVSEVFKIWNSDLTQNPRMREKINDLEKLFLNNHREEVELLSAVLASNC